LGDQGENPRPVLEPLKEPHAGGREAPCGAADPGGSAPQGAEDSRGEDGGTPDRETTLSPQGGVERSGEADYDDDVLGKDDTAPGPRSLPGEPTAYTFWKGKRRELAEHFGGAWGAWLEALIPLAYDGKRLKLGAYNKFAMDFINGLAITEPGPSLRAQLAERLGLEVEVVVYNLSVHQMARRQAEKAERLKAAEA
jgi:hypothetical protein